MILETIMIFTGVAAIGSLASVYLHTKKPSNDSISIKKYMPGDLPIITLTNNGIALNFLIDTGSNISHIIPSVLKDIKGNKIQNNNEIAGIGAITNESSSIEVKVKDTLSKEYDITLVISKGLENSAKYIEQSTGVKIHGLLGTDFLQKYQYVIDFKTLEVYSKK
jgi:hypothetical protein